MELTHRSALIAVVLATASLASEREVEPPPNPKQMRDLAEDPARQARLLLHDTAYMRSLDLALAKRASGLRRLFRFTTTEAFVGAGAESHCAILRDLLRLLGDDFFARILRDERPKVRSAVIHALDYAWPCPGWQPSQFPATYGIAKHQKIPSSAP